MRIGTDYDPALFRVLPTFLQEGTSVRTRFLYWPLRNGRLASPVRARIIDSLPVLRRKYEEFVNAHFLFMRQALEITQATVYLDATKSMRRAEMLLSADRSMRRPVILLVRNPLSWCASWLRKRKRANVSGAARAWRAYAQRAFTLCERFPEAQLHIVRYEDLCNDPEATLRRLEEHLGIPHCRVPDSSNDGAAHHVLGNVMRFEFDGIVRAPSDKSDELSSEQRQAIIAGSGACASRLGYELSD
ncbi:sulfotransferase family protein [Lentisalinibacter sediminis]|uniref:sulfotransferase family protein n=1 Tax=Lentisalinibacter sediminis TaxID=2992237 RepID=UPI00386F8FF2